MKILILCGGKGSRLLPIVSDRPKVLADVNGKPFLHYLLKQVKEGGFKNVILCVGHGADKVKDFVKEQGESAYGSESGCALNISFSEDLDLGTGGAIKNAGALIGGEPFVAMNGDTWISDPFTNLRKYWIKYPSSRMLGVNTKFQNAGVYHIPAWAVEDMPNGASNLDVYMNDTPRIVVGDFIDIGTPEGYERIKEVLHPNNS